MNGHLAAGTLVQAILLSMASVAAWVAIQGEAFFYGEVRSVLRVTGSVRRLAVLDDEEAAIFNGLLMSPVVSRNAQRICGVYDLTTNPPRLKHRFEGVDAWRVCAGRNCGFVSTGDGALYLYDPRKDGPVLTPFGQQGFQVADVLECPDDGSILFSSSSTPLRRHSDDDSTTETTVEAAAAAWDRHSRSRLWHRSDVAITACAFSPAGRRMFVALDDGAVLELDPPSGATLRQIDQLSERVCALSVAPGGDRLISGDSYGHVAAIELSTGRRLWSRRYGETQCWFAWKDRDVVIASGQEVTLVCSGSGRPLAAVGQFELVLQVAAAASRHVYVCSDGEVTVWNPDAERELRMFSPKRDWNRHSAFGR